MLTGELTGDFGAFDAKSETCSTIHTGGADGRGVVTYAGGGSSSRGGVREPANYGERNPGAPTMV